MSEAELAAIWGLVAVLGFVLAGLGAIEGLYLGLAALVALGLVFVAPAWVGLLVFVLLMAIALPVTWLLVRRTRFSGRDADQRDEFAGRAGIVVEAIESSRDRGRVQIGDEILPARILFDHHGPVRVGTRVLVEGHDADAVEVVPPKVLMERHARGELSRERLEELLGDTAP
jgi:membrane protein implicated in regulation of membrane protease activity